MYDQQQSCQIRATAGGKGRNAERTDVPSPQTTLKKPAFSVCHWSLSFDLGPMQTPSRPSCSLHCTPVRNLITLQTKPHSFSSVMGRLNGARLPPYLQDSCLSNDKSMAQHQIEVTVTEREWTTPPAVFYWVVTARRARLEPLSRNRDSPDGTLLVLVFQPHIIVEIQCLFLSMLNKAAINGSLDVISFLACTVVTPLCTISILSQVEIESNIKGR